MEAPKFLLIEIWPNGKITLPPCHQPVPENAILTIGELEQCKDLIDNMIDRHENYLTVRKVDPIIVG